jgi:hypothetical protein
MATSSFVPAGAGHWRAATGLLALLLHGALLLAWRPSRPPADGAARDDGTLLLAMRLYAAPAQFKTVPPTRQRRPASAMSRTVTASPRAVTGIAAAPDYGTPPAATIPVASAVPVPSAAAAITPAAMATSAASATVAALDIDALKAVARKNAGEGERRALPGDTPAMSASSKARRALEGARRPTCDQNYRPTLGPVGFAGLLTLPFMLKEGASDSGCRW